MNDRCSQPTPLILQKQSTVLRTWNQTWNRSPSIEMGPFPGLLCCGSEEGDVPDIEGIIRVLGLAPTKAKNLSAMSKVWPLSKTSCRLDCVLRLAPTRHGPVCYEQGEAPT
eukprot:1068905-Pelagomonas_calceolata.AAC.2